MTDTRIKKNTTKAINLTQLDTELGGHGLCSGARDSIEAGGTSVTIVVPEESPVTIEQLTAAIAAHTPVWPPTTSDRITAAIDAATTLDELKVTLKDLLA